MTHALSIDWEYWWCNKFLGKISNKEELSIEETTIQLLDFLDKYNCKATFFILGLAAKRHPDIIKEIYKRGHEIGSHGYSHTSLFELTKKEFEDEINKSLNTLSQYKVKGFRAPYFSVSNANKWYLNILNKYGFVYDSSIIPTKLALNGILKAPSVIYKPSELDITTHSDSAKLIEIPLSVTPWLIKLPFSGGFYARLLPLSLIKLAITKTDKEKPTIFYFHSWEIYNKPPKLSVLTYPPRITTYIGINSIITKLENILKNYKLDTISNVLQNISIEHLGSNIK